MIRDLEERLLMLGRDMRSRGNELQDKVRVSWVLC
jgi:hypothetical protein